MKSLYYASDLAPEGLNNNNKSNRNIYRGKTLSLPGGTAIDMGPVLNLSIYLARNESNYILEAMLTELCPCLSSQCDHTL